MVEIGGRNPPLPPNVVTQAHAQPQNHLLDRSSAEEQPDNRSLLPPNYVSLRQLRERRLKEEKAKEKEIEKGKEREKETNNCASVSVPPNYVSLRQLQEWRLKEEKEKENGREEESENRPRRPPNYVSLRQLQEQRLKEEKEREKEKEKEKEKEEDEVRGKMKEKANEKGEKYSLLPANYISLRQLRELRLQEKEEKEVEEEAPKTKIQQTKVQKEGDESGQIEVEINKKACNLARNPQSNCKHGCVKSSWVWEPVHPPAGTSASAGGASADSMFLPENAGVSHAVVMASSDQNEDAEMKLKNQKKKRKKKKKKKSRKNAFGKNNGEPVQGPELLMEVTDLKIGEEVNAFSSATKERTLYQNGNNTVKEGKGGNVNLTESSSQTIPVLVHKKRFNGAQSMRFKMHNSRDKRKGKEVNLSEQNRNVVPLNKVAAGSDEVEEVIGSKSENDEQKGKGKMINIPELSDQTPCHEEAKGVLGAGEVIGSEILNGEEKGMGKNVNLPESSKRGGQIGGFWRKRNQAAGIRGRGHPRARAFPARPAEHLRGGGSLVWVPKKGS